MKIISWNVNGLRSLTKGVILNNLLIHNDIDIVCFNETKLNDNNCDDIREKINKILNYDYHYYYNSQLKKGYSGTYIITKYKPINVLYGIKIDKKQYDLEGRVLTLEYENHYIINVYVPNAGEYLKRLDWKLEEWYSYFIKYITILKKKKEVIICGDFNVAHNEIDIKNPDTNRNTSGFTDRERNHFTYFLKTFNFIDVYRELYPSNIEYTYWTYRNNARQKNIGWRIDYIISTRHVLKYITDCNILNAICGSDHAPIIFTIDTKIIL